MSIKIENTLSEVAFAGGLNTAKPASFTATAAFTGVLDASSASQAKLPGSTIVNSSGIFLNKTLTTATAQNASLTATGLLGGIYAHTTTVGAGTATLPLGATISSLISGVATGTSFETSYINNGTGGTGTITGATGTTVVGTAAVPTLKNATLRFYNSGTNAWNIYVVVSA